MWSRAYNRTLRPSVCPFHHVTAAPTCGGFVAERRAYTNSRAAALATANVSSVTFTTDLGIRKLKSDLLLQAIITVFEWGTVSL